MVACPRVAHLGRRLGRARCPQLETLFPLMGICGRPFGPPRPVPDGPKGPPSPRVVRAQDLGPLGPGTRPSGPSPTAPPFGGWGGELESARQQLARASPLRPGTRCSAQNGWKTGRGEASGPAEAGWARSVAAASWLSPKPTANAPCCWASAPTPPLPAGGRRARDGRLRRSDGRSSGLRRARVTAGGGPGRPRPSRPARASAAASQAGRAAQGCCCCC